MKALSHWLAEKGHTPKSQSQHFDEEFYQQVLETGKIEEGRIIRNYFRRTGQPLKQNWLIRIVGNLIRGLPLMMLARMGLATLVRPRTKNWSQSKQSISELIESAESERAQAIQRK